MVEVGDASEPVCFRSRKECRVPEEKTFESGKTTHNDSALRFIPCTGNLPLVKVIFSYKGVVKSSTATEFVGAPSGKLTSNPSVVFP